VAAVVIVSPCRVNGSNGIQMSTHWGGTVMAQDEASSAVLQRPRSAMATGGVDAVLSLEQIVPALVAQVATRRHVESNEPFSPAHSGHKRPPAWRGTCTGVTRGPGTAPASRKFRYRRCPAMPARA
jgi:hypothetical protein